MSQVVQHTLYRSQRLRPSSRGFTKGAVRVATLREHGDLGLGTFEDLDGEMVIVEGHGSVREVEDSTLSPFAAITAFSPAPQ
jgi:acetolactate decarboxylase